MQISKEESHAMALEAIIKNKLMFVEDVVAMMPISKQTFYNHGLDEFDDIKEAMNKNRIDMKRGLRVKWYKSDNATAQIALYRLLGTDAELDRLTVSKHRVEQIKEQPLFPDEIKPPENE